MVTNTPGKRVSVRAVLVLVLPIILAQLNVPAEASAAITAGVLAAVETFTPINQSFGWNK